MVVEVDVVGAGVDVATAGPQLQKRRYRMDTAAQVFVLCFGLLDEDEKEHFPTHAPEQQSPPRQMPGLCAYPAIHGLPTQGAPTTLPRLIISAAVSISSMGVALQAMPGPTSLTQAASQDSFRAERIHVVVVVVEVVVVVVVVVVVEVDVVLVEWRVTK